MFLKALSLCSKRHCMLILTKTLICNEISRLKDLKLHVETSNEYESLEKQIFLLWAEISSLNNLLELQEGVNKMAVDMDTRIDQYKENNNQISADLLAVVKKRLTFLTFLTTQSKAKKTFSLSDKAIKKHAKTFQKSTINQMSIERIAFEKGALWAREVLLPNNL